MKKQQIVIILSLFLIIILFPVYFTWQLTGQNGVFGGIIANPLDGQSYLAKMAQGADGNFLFHLPYTSPAGDGQPLFLFYILLGHISRLINLPLIFVFHMARVFSALFLGWSLYVLLTKSLQPASINKALLLLLFGSGMGWLLSAVASGVPVDFYVAEMYPFLSSYTNPHFPLGTGIIIWIFIRAIEYRSIKDFMILFILGLLLSAVLQFGIVLVLLCLAGLLIWQFAIKKEFNFLPIISIFSGGGIWLAYQYLIIKTDAVLNIWDQQNVTSAPDPINLLAGLSPLLILLVVEIFFNRQKPTHPIIQICIIWLFTGIVLTYIPFNLQRRFLTGLYIPLVILFIFYFETWPIKTRLKNGLFQVVFYWSIITNLIIVFMGLSTINKPDSILFLQKSEYKSLIWLKENSQMGDVILASPELSLYIPVISSRQVVYGHPFETIHAADKKQKVIEFYQNMLIPERKKEFIRVNDIRYIILGPREKTFGDIQVSPDWQEEYSDGNVRIYEIQH